jgi:multisubunit Na+/H+ antiporter MnhG subunit
MTSLKDKVTKALDETHILVLGTQILLGFAFQAMFQPGFERLPPAGRWLSVCVVALLLAAFLFLVAPTPFHRIAEHGESTGRMHRFTSAVATAALLPFALALGLGFVLPLQKAFGSVVAVFAGVAMSVAALVLWYGLELARKRKDIRLMQNLPQPGDQASLKDRIQQLLTEARIVLPGAQALLGFQLAAYFTDAFEKLPWASKVVHTASALLLGLTVMLLMAPAAYHRIVDAGEETPEFERFAARMVIGALVPLALALSAAVYVVLARVSSDPSLSAAIAIGTATVLLGCWLLLPLAVRRTGMARASQAERRQRA